MIDFHAHIIPNIDDGAKNAGESVNMLRVLFAQGVKTVVAAPHFYAEQYSIEEFSARRMDRLKTLKNAMEESGGDFPQIALGCEVLFFPTIYAFEGISELCISGTDYMLLEMPMQKWTQSIFESVCKLNTNRGIIPVIAHADRYLPYGNGISQMKRLKESGALIQVNCDFFDGFFKRRKAFSFAKNGLIDVLGSDCHNLSTRPPEIKQALAVLRESFGSRYLERIEQTSEKILKDAVLF